MFCHSLLFASLLLGLYTMAKVVFKEGVGSCESMDDRSEWHQYYDDIGSAEPQFLALKMICEAAVKLSDEEVRKKMKLVFLF